MSLRWLVGLACAGAWLLSPAAGRADLASPGERIVASEVVLTGLSDFPRYRFVVAVIPLRADADIPRDVPLPTPSAAREGEPLPTSTTYFQQVRAIPAAASEPVTDAWLASSQAPGSGSISLPLLRVPIASGERVARTSYRVRQVRAGWISLELTSAVAVMADGSQRVRRRPVPQSYLIESVAAPPGWQLYLMPDPSWPRTDPPLPVVPCNAGDLLPLSPGPRTLVAVQGSPSADGSVAGRPFVTWGRRLDEWERDHVSPSSRVVSTRTQLLLRVAPGHELNVATMQLYEDAQGRWFYDEEATLPFDGPTRWWRWGAAAAGVTLVLGACGWWVLRRRRRRQPA